MCDNANTEERREPTLDELLGDPMMDTLLPRAGHHPTVFRVLIAMAKDRLADDGEDDGRKAEMTAGADSCG